MSRASDAPHLFLAQRLRTEKAALCRSWLERLEKLLPTPADQIFPTQELLDHMPALLAEMAADLDAPDTRDFVSNSVVDAKARELGELRYEQNASVHQIVREFDILAMVLDEFVLHEVAGLDPAPAAPECLLILSRLHRAVRLLLQATVDTFSDHYAATIEEQRDRLASFNRMVSHELRTPVGTVEMASELLAGEQDPTECSRLADVIRRNSIRTRQILEGLDSMRPDAGDAIDHPLVQVVELDSLVRDVASRLQGMAIERGVEIRIDPPLPTLEADVAKLEMVLRNLISNGIKYSDPARSDAYVEIRAAVDGDRLRLEVADNGLGIEREAQQRAFERFTRLHAELDGALEVHGHGLGLAITRDCVRSLGGEIELDSVPGRGSTFLVKLPLRPEA